MANRYYDIGLRVGEDIPTTQRTSADGADQVAMANAEIATRAIDEKIADLAKNWKPTGYYSVEEMQTLLRETLNLSHAAIQSLGEAPHSTGDSETQIKQALNRLWRNGAQALEYVDKMRAAKPGALVEAKGLKDWIIHTMINASQGFQTASVMQENLSWYLRAIAAYKQKFDAVATIVKKAGNIAWDGIQAVLDVPIDVAKKLGWTALKILGGIAVVGGVGYIVIKKETK